MPIYAEDVYFDENYIIVPENAVVENVDEEADVDEVEEENVEEVEEEIVNESDNAVLGIEEDRNIDSDLFSTHDFSDLEGFSNVAISSSRNADPLAIILA